MNLKWSFQRSFFYVPNSSCSFIKSSYLVFNSFGGYIAMIVSRNARFTLWGWLLVLSGLNKKKIILFSTKVWCNNWTVFPRNPFNNFRNFKWKSLWIILHKCPFWGNTASPHFECKLAIWMPFPYESSMLNTKMVLDFHSTPLPPYKCFNWSESIHWKWFCSEKKILSHWTLELKDG